MEKNFWNNLVRLTYYNVKIIFGNKFVYFILSAVLFYILTVFINLLTDSEVTEATAYNMLLIPSILLIFYPMCFGIQNDQDAKIIEIIFGIPNYRYKVWLFRLLVAYVICFGITMGLALLTDWLLVEVAPLELTSQVLVPVFFIGMLCFMLSTIVKNGNGTAVIIIILGLIFFILDNLLEVSKWNVFLNPFDIPLYKNPVIFFQTLLYNRIILGLASLVFLVAGLYNTQHREKFI
ncbi:hypothetical protein [uncultured Odoribacter sp.]|uniref:hypothetical protein n=1 Tax=uncultured Odoribacter sp. TaxID=876416 RepID=UPI00262CBEC9|nr:hypothetical protein [uncultured Odoribacter sp.]